MQPNTLTQSLSLSHRETCELFKALNPSGTVGFDAQRKTLAYMRTVLQSWAEQQPALVPIMEAHSASILAARNAASAPAIIPPPPALAEAMPAPPALPVDGQHARPQTVREAIAEAIDAASQPAPAVNPLTPPVVVTGNNPQPMPIPPAPFRQDAPQEVAPPVDATPAPATAMPAPSGPQNTPATLPALPFGRMYVRHVFADLQRKAPAVYAALPPYLSVPAWPAGHFPQAEAPNPSFRWTADTLLPALIGLGTVPAVPMLFYGAAGTGKTEAARQLAARCGRPFVRINCNRHTESADILGDVGLNANGTEWVNGPFALACEYPHGAAMVLVDEPSYTNAGALACLSPVLERGGAALSLPKTGKVLNVHPDMAVIFADNTALSGDTTGAYHMRNEMGEDIRQRLAFKLRFDYLPAAEERALLAEAIKAQTGKTATAAALAPLMKILSVCRQQCDAGVLQGAPSFRGAVAFALLVAHGVAPDKAFDIAITYQAPAESQQALREIFRAHVASDAAPFANFAYTPEAI